MDGIARGQNFLGICSAIWAVAEELGSFKYFEGVIGYTSHFAQFKSSDLSGCSC